MPKMWIGSSGMMIVSMSLVMMARNSMKPLRRTPRGMRESPMPMTKESSRAVMTSSGAGISTVK